MVDVDSDMWAQFQALFHTTPRMVLIIGTPTRHSLPML
jgi:hypothetical protein